MADVQVNSCEDRDSLPNVVFEVMGMPDSNGNQQVVELILTPEDYVLQFEINGRSDCVLGIGPDTEDTGWTLGQVFLKAFYIVFDREGKGKIGFVRSNMNPSPPPGRGPDSRIANSHYKSMNFKQKMKKEIQKSISEVEDNN